MSDDTLTYLAERPHAPYSPSRLPYLEACPGWIGFSETSEVAERGTKIGMWLADYVVNGTDPRQAAPEDWLEAIEAGMLHLDTIRGTWPDVIWSAEDRIDTSVPDCYGYVDLVGLDDLIGDTVLIELKTGRGDRAPAEHNRQVQALALGLLEAGRPFVAAYLIECDRGTCTEAMFIDSRPLKSAVKALVLNATHATDQDLQAGTQCRYCTRREQCPRAAESPDLAMEAIGERTLSPKDYAGALSPDALGETLTKVAPLVSLADDYLGALKARAMQIIESGGEVPGWTVKTTGGHRSWNDEAAAAGALLEAGFDLTEVRGLLSVAQVEKRLGKEAKPVIAPFVAQGQRKNLVEVTPR